VKKDKGFCTRSASGVQSSPDRGKLGSWRERPDAALVFWHSIIGAPGKVLVFQRVKAPPGNSSLQPEVIGVTVEETKPLKPSM